MISAALLAATALSGCSPAGSKSETAAAQSQEKIFSYDISKAPEGFSASLGNVHVLVLGKPGGEGGDNNVDLSAAIRFPDGNLSIAQVGGGPIDAQRELWIGKLSPADTTNSVVLSNWTGGNQCCSEISIVSQAYGGSSVLRVDLRFGSDLETAFGDFNHDGTKDIVTFDPRFLAAFFESGAGSYSIPKVVNVFKGQLVDISRDPSLKSYWDQAQAIAGRDCADPEMTDNGGACAAYVAIGARRGQVEEAIKFAAGYMREKDTPYLICRYETASNNDCPEQNFQEFYDFRTAIKFALRVYGYT